MGNGRFVNSFSRYFHAQVLDEIDRILETDYKVIERLEVEVMTL